MMKKTKVLIGLITTCALAFAASPAFAATTNSSFSTTLANLQQPRYVGTQTKTHSNMSGHVSISNVGSNYTVNVRMRQMNTLNYGSEQYNLGDGSSAWLPNSFASGTSTGISIVNSTWALVSVSVSGSYRTN